MVNEAAHRLPILTQRPASDPTWIFCSTPMLLEYCQRKSALDSMSTFERLNLFRESEAVQRVRLFPLEFQETMLTSEIREDQKRATITAIREIILSAGAIGSSHILLNSGIGDKKDLDAVGVKTIHHLPEVGKDLSEHMTVSLSWTARGSIPPA